VIIFMVVDLPAPLGPEKPQHFTARDRERDVTDRLQRAEVLAQTFDFNQGFHAVGLLYAACLNGQPDTRRTALRARSAMHGNCRRPDCVGVRSTSSQG
jgi:hypothetical protein